MEIKNINNVVADKIGESVLPKSFVFDITDRCQMKCVTCSKWKTPASVKDKELSTEEWKNVILKLKNWVGRYAFILSGGEPFLRQDIFEIINYAGSLDLPVTVITNAFSLENLVDKIIESPISSLTVSLNSLIPDKHDQTRGREGSLRKAIDFLKEINKQRRLRNKNIKLNLSTIIMPDNLDEIISLVDFVKNEGLDAIFVQLLEDPSSFHPYYETGPISAEDSLSSQEMLSDSDFVRQKTLILLNELIKLKKEGMPIRNSFNQLESMKIFINNPEDVLNIKCMVGYNNIFVDPYGNIRVCGNYGPIGTHEQEDFSLLWNNDKVNLQRKHIENCGMYCRLINCNFKRDN